MKIKNKIFLIVFILTVIFFSSDVKAYEETSVITNETDTIIEGYINITLEQDDDEKLMSSNFVAPKSNDNSIITNIDRYYYSQLTNNIGRKIYNALSQDTTGKGDC